MVAWTATFFTNATSTASRCGLALPAGRLSTRASFPGIPSPTDTTWESGRSQPPHAVGCGADSMADEPSATFSAAAAAPPLRYKVWHSPSASASVSVCGAQIGEAVLYLLCGRGGGAAAVQDLPLSAAFPASTPCDLLLPGSAPHCVRGPARSAFLSRMGPEYYDGGLLSACDDWYSGGLL